jgi:hypothetical protein
MKIARQNSEMHGIESSSLDDCANDSFSKMLLDINHAHGTEESVGHRFFCLSLLGFLIAWFCADCLGLAGKIAGSAGELPCLWEGR